MFSHKAIKPCLFGSLLVFIIFLGIAGCSEPAPPAAPPEPVTITFGYSGFENRTAVREYYQEMADQFNQKYPHITVEVGFDELSSVFIGQGIEEDVVLVLQYVFAWLLPNEYIIPLDALIEMDPSFPVDDYLPGVLDFYVFDGKTWGVPASIEPYVIFYNKEIFDQKGVPYPDPNWTLDEFLAAAISTRDPSANFYGYASTNFFAPDSRYMESITFIYQHGGVLFDDYKLPTQILFDDPRTMEALEWYTNLYSVHNIAPTEQEALEAFGGTIDNTIYQGITSGKVAMWGGGFSEMNGSYWWPAPLPVPFGILPPPRGEGAFYPAYSNAYVISSESHYPEEAWLWINFLADQINPDAFPVRKSMTETKAFEDIVGSEYVDILRGMLDELESYPLFIGSDITRDGSDFQRALDRTIDQGEDLHEVLDWVEDQ